MKHIVSSSGVLIAALVHEAMSTREESHGLLLGVSRRRPQRIVLRDDDKDEKESEIIETRLLSYALAGSLREYGNLYEASGKVDKKKAHALVQLVVEVDPADGDICIVGLWTARHNISPTPSMRDVAAYNSLYAQLEGDQRLIILSITVDTHCQAHYRCVERSGRTLVHVPLAVRTLSHSSQKNYEAFEDPSSWHSKEEQRLGEEQPIDNGLILTFRNHRQALDGILSQIDAVNSEEIALGAEIAQLELELGQGVGTSQVVEEVQATVQDQQEKEEEPPPSYEDLASTTSVLH
eukprot:CAMPEP_0197309304 /NCGR_PEP_ID=MMETSP0891-20130614/7878_1 /TAXON_ID=44058 ORGANISM="Aureoumbra lagunensis, Strain CCMP1510" /NCGR_SAMPLE_ID=MMETSP0891 /ASSEMBLY_ACC=CAM_ASM_000534 /LENGTH=292 /DNA_ID=CAMNT_0042794291 /DNA_START=40 /DNA_END=918 /DNA_ORIENTATION=+